MQTPISPCLEPVVYKKLEGGAFLARASEKDVAFLPEKWMHVSDELYSKLRGPAKILTLLATACGDTTMGATGEDEPALFTIQYGKGRVFHTILGHDVPQLHCVGFIATFQRGVEWAATGAVTRTNVPADFPTADKVSTRP